MVLKERHRHARRQETPKKSYYTVVEGTALYTGPKGGFSEYLMRAEGRMVVIPLARVTNNGVTSFWVEVESPPELRGDHFWVVKNPHGRGFLR